MRRLKVGGELRMICEKRIESIIVQVANVGLCNGTVVVDVVADGELNDTAAKGSDTVRLCVKEEYRRVAGRQLVALEE